MPVPFVHLHVHTQYSLLDGAARIDNLVAAAKNLGMPALAITDHGAMYGVIEFYKTCQKQGIKPILGCEVYVAPRSRHDKQANVDAANYHLVLLAENREGYQNLLSLVSLGFTEGFYYKPRVDKEILARHSKGLIALSACLAGEIASLILAGQREQARQAAREYAGIFGPGNFFLELQDHRLEEQRLVNRELLKMARELDLPLVATNDLHYIRREDAQIQDVLLCIQTGRTLDEEDRMKFGTEEFYLKSGEEMALLFGEWPEALENTLKIAERCQVDLSFNEIHLPYYQVPEGHTLDSYLEAVCYQGARQRYGLYSKEEARSGKEGVGPGQSAGKKGIRSEVRERLDYELGIIREMGYSGYFLIVWDFVRFAKDQGILVGPGRGSAAGSLVAYLLGITNIDPLRYGLLFERFLNPERVSMPDIDIDFCFERREEVIDYVVRKYGADRVSQIITFGTMAARAAIRDVGRVMNIPYGEVDKVAKLVPAELGVTIARALENSPELKALYDANAQVRKLVDTAAALEGMPRHASTHAAGVVISREPLTHYLPLYRTSDGVVTTQFPKETVEELGLLKMDLLGLRTLTVIQEALRLIEKNRGIKLDPDNLPMDDPATYEMLGKGESIGVFQLESSGMRAILRDLKPGNFEDIIALVALYRPGPLGSGMVDDFIRGKHGGAVKYLHPVLEPILRETYGVILYQEQVMRIASEMAGFSLGQADLLRRAMGKKKPAEMAKQREKFLAGATARGYEAQLAGKIFDLMEYFAGYGFNKSHSAAYAMVAYQTAYLKANYPLEYMAALLTSVMDSSDKVALYIDECRKMGISILPPDVNESWVNFTVSRGKLRFGLAAVKNVGRGAIEAIIEARAEKAFTSLQDFCQRVDSRALNKRILESLIKAGAFSTLPGNRAQLLEIMEKCLEDAQRRQKEKTRGQISFFDLAATPEFVAETISLPDRREFPQSEILAMEKEILGFYLSGHPLESHRKTLQALRAMPLHDLAEGLPDRPVTVGGIIVNCKRITTRKGEPMAFLQLEDLTGTAEVVCFPSVYRRCSSLLDGEEPILVRGRTGSPDEGIKILAEEIVPLAKAPAESRLSPEAAHRKGEALVYQEEMLRPIDLVQVRREEAAASEEPTTSRGLAAGGPAAMAHEPAAAGKLTSAREAAGSQAGAGEALAFRGLAAGGPAASPGAAGLAEAGALANGTSGKKLFLKIDVPSTPALEAKLRLILQMNPGPVPVIFYFPDKPKGQQLLRAHPSLWVTLGERLLEDLVHVLGPHCVKVKE